MYLFINFLMLNGYKNNLIIINFIFIQYVLSHFDLFEVKIVDFILFE